MGGARVAAIDAGAFAGDPGRHVRVRGFVEAVPRRTNGEAHVRVQTRDGRLLVAAPEPVGELPVGDEVEAEGVLRRPQPWERDQLARLGIARIVQSGEITRTGDARGGLAAVTDELRGRAVVALGSGTPPAESALLRGFVLGEDDRIDPGTVAEFQESGLAHLLAVSGQNVLLLALLAAPILALLGVGLRARLLCVLLLIALYVPIAGAGASIQRAGIMGAAGIVAAMAGRPAARWYAMALAAVATLVLNPRAAGDVGWQLSFAAVAGIALWTTPLRGLLAAGSRAGRARRAVSEAAALTLAATVATAPLMAHHFEQLSLAALPANLVALPAVAPVMWLGMLSAAAGQLPVLPTDPITGLAGICAGFIAQTASWFAAPAWAQMDAPLPSPLTVSLIYVLLIAAGFLLERRLRSWRGQGVRKRPVALAGAGLALVVAATLTLGGSQDAPPLRVSVLDVGQGDAILLAPQDALPILVDTGPPGADTAERLGELGVERLAAVVVSHEDSDHSGELHDVLSRLAVDTVAYGAPAPALHRAARATGTPVTRLSEGMALASGSLELDVLWPPRALLDGPRPHEPNARSVVLRARWRGFDLLLPGDGEAEALPLDPGPVDVLKVAHHGSEDAGLEHLLDRAAPRAAVISVGAENPYGHPAPSVLGTLTEHGVNVMRTDQEGELTLEVTRAGWSLEGDG